MSEERTSNRWLSTAAIAAILCGGCSTEPGESPATAKVPSGERSAWGDSSAAAQFGRITGGGVPVQTFVPRPGFEGDLYIDLYHEDWPPEPPGIDVAGKVEIAYERGKPQFVYVPPGSWDCWCTKESDLGETRTARTRLPDDVNPGNKAEIERPMPICEETRPGACPSRYSNSTPECWSRPNGP